MRAIMIHELLPLAGNGSVFVILAALFVLGVNDLPARGQLAHQPDAIALARRMQQATDLKAGADEYIRQARAFHKTARKRIAEARKLEGKALYLAQALKSDSSSTNNSSSDRLGKSPLQGSLQFTQGIHPPASTPLTLTAKQYRLSLNQYSDDISKFMEHAQQFDQHLRSFAADMGTCHQNEQAYAENVQKYAMHIDEFHLPNFQLPSVAMSLTTIRPPHICPRMMLSHEEAGAIRNQYFNDQIRVLAAEQDLETAEGKLQAAQQEAGAVNAKLETEIKRGQGERDLAIEFGRLREEYDLIKVERGRIATSIRPATHPSTQDTAITRVQGKIHNKTKG